MPRPSFTAAVKPPVHIRSVTKIMAESASWEESLPLTDIKENYQNRNPEASGEKQKQKTWKQTQRGKEEARQGHSKTEAKPNGNSQPWQTLLHIL